MAADATAVAAPHLTPHTGPALATCSRPRVVLLLWLLLATSLRRLPPPRRQPGGHARRWGHHILIRVRVGVDAGDADAVAATPAAVVAANPTADAATAAAAVAARRFGHAGSQPWPLPPP